MKKLTKISVAISLMTMLLVGCGTDNVDNTNNNTGTENITTNENTATDDNISSGTDFILYENFDIGFSIQIPSSWEGKYSIEELEDTYGDDIIESVSFYHNASVNEIDAGWLFSFSKITGDQFTQDELPNATILEQTGGYTYVVGFPTDVQYNEDLGSESAIEYKEMRSHADFLISTFKVIEK